MSGFGDTQDREYEPEFDAESNPLEDPDLDSGQDAIERVCTECGEQYFLSLPAANEIPPEGRFDVCLYECLFPGRASASLVANLRPGTKLDSGVP